MTIDDFVAEAESWVGTPFINQACLKGVGVDCTMLAYKSLVDSGLASGEFDVAYRVAGGINPQPKIYERFTEILNVPFRRINPKTLLKGDILVFKLQGVERHISIAIDNGTHINACYKFGVRKEPITSRWRDRISWVGRLEP